MEENFKTEKIIIHRRQEKRVKKDPVEEKSRERERERDFWVRESRLTHDDYK